MSACAADGLRQVRGFQGLVLAVQRSQNHLSPFLTLQFNAVDFRDATARQFGREST